MNVCAWVVLALYSISFSFPTQGLSQTADELLAQVRDLRSWCAGYGGPYGSSEKACEEETRVAGELRDLHNICFDGLGPMSNYTWQDCDNIQRFSFQVTRTALDFKFDGIRASMVVSLSPLNYADPQVARTASDGLDFSLVLSCGQRGEQGALFSFREGVVQAAGGGAMVYDLLGPDLPIIVGSYSASTSSDFELQLSLNPHGRLPVLIEEIYQGTMLEIRFHDPEGDNRVTVISLYDVPPTQVRDQLGQMFQTCRLLS